MLKCFLVAVVTVLMTAPSKRDGEDEDKLDEMNWSCLEEGAGNRGGHLHEDALGKSALLLLLLLQQFSHKNVPLKKKQNKILPE